MEMISIISPRFPPVFSPIKRHKGPPDFPRQQSFCFPRRRLDTCLSLRKALAARVPRRGHPSPPLPGSISPSFSIDKLRRCGLKGSGGFEEVLQLRLLTSCLLSRRGPAPVCWGGGSGMYSSLYRTLPKYRGPLKSSTSRQNTNPSETTLIVNHNKRIRAKSVFAQTKFIETNSTKSDIFKKYSEMKTFLKRILGWSYIVGAKRRQIFEFLIKIDPKSVVFEPNIELPQYIALLEYLKFRHKYRASGSFFAGLNPGRFCT